MSGLRKVVNSMPRIEEQSLAITMASDEKYIPYITTALRSIRRYNTTIQIDVYSCANIRPLLPLDGVNARFHEVTVPKKLTASLDGEELAHASTRVAKLESLTQRGTDKLMYVDCDIVVLDDLGKITQELPVDGSDNPIVYMLLRRPDLLSVNDLSWLYFRDSSQLSNQQMTGLVNDTFSLDYSTERFQALRCWNGGLVYGSTQGVNILGDLWKDYYNRMLTHRDRGSFIPNDQLCLWLAAEQLEKVLTIRELPLAWNFMPGHALEEVMGKADPKLEEIKKALGGVKILHFAQNKTDPWVQVLVDDINSEKGSSFQGSTTP